MIFTDEEMIDFSNGACVNGSYYLTLLFERLNITLDSIQDNRWYLLDQCCAGNFQPQVSNAYNLMQGSQPASDRLHLTAMWIIYGDPDPDTNVPWATQEIVDTLQAALLSQFYTLFDCRTTIGYFF